MNREEVRAELAKRIRSIIVAEAVDAATATILFIAIALSF